MAKCCIKSEVKWSDTITLSAEPTAYMRPFGGWGGWDGMGGGQMTEE